MNGSRLFVNGGEDRRRWLPLLRVTVVVVAGLVLWRLGPFGTFGELRPIERLAYWLGLTAFMWVQGIVALAVIRRTYLATLVPGFALVILAALAGAVPTAFEVAWAEMLLRVDRDLGPLDLVAIYGDVALLAVPLLLLTHGTVEYRRGSRVDPGPPIAEPFDIVGQMPPSKRGKLVALAAEDHYVRVHTDRGQHLLHMRFGDALKTLAEDQGCQVHRGWWVANGAVVSERREGDQVRIELADGTSVPVSRTHIRAACAAGLIGSAKQ